MTLADIRIPFDPVALVLGCFIWFPLMVWICSLVHWMVTNEIDIIQGLGGIAVGLLLGYVAMKPPVPILSPIAFCTVILTIILYPFLRIALNQRELRKIDAHALERAYLVLGERPRDPMARFRVAQAAWTLGLNGHALRLGEVCLEELPQKVFVEEHSMVRRWRREPLPPTSFAPIPCGDCSAPVDPGRTHCAACGAPYLLERVKGGALGRTLGRKLLAAWIAGVGGLIGITIATQLPPAAALGSIIVILALAILVVALAFRPQGQKA